MSGEETSPERTRAYHRWREAEQQAARGHLKEAADIVRDALDIDPGYVDIRHWLAELYERAGQPRKAVVEYQEIIHANREDLKAWERIRALDPQVAERLDRLHHIGADPFVAQRANADLSDDLDDLGSITDDIPDRYETEQYVSTHDPAVSEADTMDDIAGTDAVQPLLEGSQPAAPKSPAAAGSQPPEWLYEEDLQYREALARDSFVAGLLPTVIEFWEENDTWDKSISGLAHLDRHRHQVVHDSFAAASEVFATPPWLLFFSPERRMVPTILRGGPPVATVTTGMMNTMKPPELQFVAGRLTAHLRAGHVGYLQITSLVLDRTPRSITDVETDMMELLRDKHSGIIGLRRDERQKLGALCHAWQQRAELSADRGGLICCRDLEAACMAIARGCCLDSNGAQKLFSWHEFRDKFKGQDVAQLAAIPTKEDPVRNEGFGYYRIRMLRYWAGTDQGKALLGTG